MSRRFIESFFPQSIQHLLRSCYYAPFAAVYQWTFPDQVAEWCPEVTWELTIIRTMLSSSSSGRVATIIRNTDSTTAAAAAGGDINTTTTGGGDIEKNNRAISILVRNPILSIWAAIGLGVGLYGAYQLLLRVLLRRRQQKQQQHSSSSSSSSLLFFAGAFFWFAMMNATALPLHCFYETAALQQQQKQHNTAASQYPILWSLDCWATGISSFCIMIGWYLRIMMMMMKIPEEEARRRNNLPAKMSSSSSSSLLLSSSKKQQVQRLENILWRLPPLQISPTALIVVGLTVTSAVVMGSFWFELFLSNNNNNDILWTLPLELWYLLPTVAAGIVTTCCIVLETYYNNSCSSSTSNSNSIVPRNNDSKTSIVHPNTAHTATTSMPMTILTELWNVLKYLSKQSSVWFLILGAVLVVGGVLADAAFCRWSHYHQNENRWYGDALMAATLTFAGCDVAFVGLYMWVTSTMTHHPHDYDAISKMKKQG